jgi:hypothetical protein
MEMVQLAALSSNALRAKDWVTLEDLSKRLLEILNRDPASNETDIREVAKNYLAAILGDGKFLLEEDHAGRNHFEKGVEALNDFLQKSPLKFRSAIRSDLWQLSQVQLLLSQPRSDARNKAASGLRKLARPDLAIELTTFELKKSRLNYYSLVVRGSAFVDLRMIDEAIEDGGLALKYSLESNKNFPLTLLARAYRDKFKRDGDFEAAESALNYAFEALRLRRNPYIAKVFISIVRAIGTAEHDDLIDELRSTLNFDFDTPDPLAVSTAQSIILASEDSDELHDDDIWLDDSESLDEYFEVDINEEDTISDYFGEYFEEYEDSLRDPRSPHLEP